MKIFKKGSFLTYYKDHSFMTNEENQSSIINTVKEIYTNGNLTNL